MGQARQLPPSWQSRLESGRTCQAALRSCGGGPRGHGAARQRAATGIPFRKLSSQ